MEQTEEGKDLPVPRYVTNQAAGMDLYACISEPILLKKGKIKVIPTGIKIALPEGYEAQIRPRNGLAAKHGIGIVNSPGTIDADYRGEIGIIMVNFGEKDFLIKRGERVAQMVINKVETIRWRIVPKLLDNIKRGSGGFGHTGK